MKPNVACPEDALPPKYLYVFVLPEITSPEEFFGHKMGEDRKIVRWNKIIEYLKILEKETDKVKIIEMGPTTMGNPFILTIITSPENQENLEEIKEINKKITDPRGTSEEEIKKLIKKAKAIICQSFSIHANEIGGTQMAPELAYELISKEDEETKRILKNVVFLMIKPLRRH